MENGFRNYLNVEPDLDYNKTKYMRLEPEESSTTQPCPLVVQIRRKNLLRISIIASTPVHHGLDVLWIGRHRRVGLLNSMKSVSECRIIHVHS